MADDECVACPRERCEDGAECMKDDLTGRLYYVMCFLCKGYDKVSTSKALRYLSATILGPPPTPPVPLSER